MKSVESDYHEISVSIAEVFAKVKAPMSDDQRMLLAGAIAPWLSQRDDRITELEQQLELRKAAVEAQFGLMEQVRTLTKSNERLRQKIDRLTGKR